MPDEKIFVVFDVSGTKVDLEAYFNPPVKSGRDWYCVLFISGVIDKQKFYGTDFSEALLNTVNFLNSITCNPIPLLVERLGLNDTDCVCVQYGKSLQES